MWTPYMMDLKAKVVIPVSNVKIKSITEMVVTLLAVLCVVFTSLQGITMAQEKIRIAWAGASPANSAIWLFKKRNCFKNKAWIPKL